MKDGETKKTTTCSGTNDDDDDGATRGVLVSTSAFLACHQC